MATLTITTTAAQDARIVAVFGRILNLKTPDTTDVNGVVTPGVARNATGPEVKAAVIAWLKQTVRETEQAIQREAAQATVTDITPT